MAVYKSAYTRSVYVSPCCWRRLSLADKMDALVQRIRPSIRNVHTNSRSCQRLPMTDKTVQGIFPTIRHIRGNLRCWQRLAMAEKTDSSVKSNFPSVRYVHISSHCCRRFAAGEKRGAPVEGFSPEIFQAGMRAIPQGFKDLKAEFMQKFKDPMFILHPNESEVLWKFNGPDSVNTWITTCDADNKEGYSECSLSTSPQGHLLLQGNLSTKVPKEGKSRRSGYVNVRSNRARKSFAREHQWDWMLYNHICLRVRGDGRSYILNIHVPGTYDISWDDVYHYVLYTRGGPYWQWTRIPFSKFMLASRGRVQDRQEVIPLWKIACLSITLSDGVPGPFSLEIDHIALQYDPNHTETFAYEQFRVPPAIADV